MRSGAARALAMHARVLPMLLAAVLVAGCSRDDHASPARIAAGEAIFRSHCAACHGAKLEGQPEWRTRRPDGKLPAPPHDDSGHTWHHPPEQLFAITKFGLVPPNAPTGYASDMPAFAGKLSDGEIRAVLAYIRSRWSPEVEKLYRERFGGE
jgi:mono/diheme cytochrome c family protein